MEIGMFELVKRVALSWQVIVITVALVVYFMLVSYVTRPHKPPRPPKEKPKKVKKVAETEVSGDTNEDLGIEEQ